MGAGDAPPVTDAFRTAVPLPDLPGLAVRHLRAPDDYPRMNEIANAARAAIGMDFTTTPDQFAEFYDRPSDFDAARDVAVIELDGRIVGYCRVGVHQEVSGPRIYEIVPFLDPSEPTEPLFGFMIALLEERARVIAGGETGEKVFQTTGGDSAPDREQVIVDAGYFAARHGYTMVRPTLDDLPDAPLPEGLEIREVRPEHMQAIWDASTEAFRDSWGFVEPNEVDYQRFLTDPVESDTSLWRVAWDGDQVAGQVRSYINPAENERFGRRRGYTESISVRRPWRRRGLARALIAASFPLLRARGMTEAALGVDTENVSGALRLYESCGFRPVSRTGWYRKPLA
jgi:ribosomal protein S18 acetylase RimI-like enzyme